MKPVILGFLSASALFGSVFSVSTKKLDANLDKLSDSVAEAAKEFTHTVAEPAVKAAVKAANSASPGSGGGNGGGGDGLGGDSDGDSSGGSGGDSGGGMGGGGLGGGIPQMGPTPDHSSENWRSPSPPPYAPPFKDYIGGKAEIIVKKDCPDQRLNAFVTSKDLLLQKAFCKEFGFALGSQVMCKFRASAHGNVEVKYSIPCTTARVCAAVANKLPNGWLSPKQAKKMEAYFTLQAADKGFKAPCIKTRPMMKPKLLA